MIDKDSHSKPKKPMSVEVRAAISRAMKKAHKEGRAHNIGESRWKNVPSYPEVFFEKVINNELKDKNYVREYAFHKYSFDFAWPHKKKYLEIDGQQHIKEDQKRRDIAKDTLAVAEGWIGLRIWWQDVYKNTRYYIDELKLFVDGSMSSEELHVLLRQYRSTEEALKLRVKRRRKTSVGGKSKLRLYSTVESRKRRFRIIYKIYLLKRSGIDFRKFGWCLEAAKIVGVKSNRVSCWMKRHMPKFYEEHCYKRGVDTARRTIESSVRVEVAKMRRFNRIYLIHKIRTAEIDFSKSDFRQRLSEICNRDYRYARWWIKDHMPKYYAENLSVFDRK